MIEKYSRRYIKSDSKEPSSGVQGWNRDVYLNSAKRNQ